MSRLLLLLFVQHAVRDQEVFLEEILGEVVESLVVGTHAIGGRNAGDAGEFVHVLYRVSYELLGERDGFGK